MIRAWKKFEYYNPFARHLSRTNTNGGCLGHKEVGSPDCIPVWESLFANQWNGIRILVRKLDLQRKNPSPENKKNLAGGSCSRDGDLSRGFCKL